MTEHNFQIKHFLQQCEYCLICNKLLKIKIKFPSIKTKNDKYYYVTKQDECLVNQKINFSLNIEHNTINYQFITDNFNYLAVNQFIEINKFCSTCLFGRYASFVIDLKNGAIEQFSLNYDHVRFFLKNHTRIELVNFYEDSYIKNRIFIGDSFTKYIELLNYINLESIVNFSQLKKRIVNAITFY